MRNIKYYKNLFLVAGIWNLVAAITCWLGSIISTELFFGLFGMPVPSSLFPFHAMFWFVIIFGIGYFIVSRDINRNHGIILIGLLGKTIFFLDCILTVLINEANIILALIGIVDLIFATLFLKFLLQTKKIHNKKAAKDL